MVTVVYSAALCGVEAQTIRVEADVSDGLPSFAMVGYVSGQVKEAQDRVRTAVRNIGLALPPKRVTINLAPADIRKEGSRFDLPIAAAVLMASARIPLDSLEGTMVIGELGLDGMVRPVSGILPSVMAAREQGFTHVIVPLENLREARNVKGILCVGLQRLDDLLVYCCHKESFCQQEPAALAAVSGGGMPDFADIAGQEQVKRAAVLAMAGFHNLLMIGPPGSGKSMTASRLPGLMPDMTEEESLEVTKIYSVAGLLKDDTALITSRPFRAPHHTISPHALAGGGRVPRPGEITLAHKGVLFLDELPEFSRNSLEILRQPLEEKKIVISRNMGIVTFPADFALVAAMNPCRCGYYPDMNRCTCSQKDISSYIHRISQPLLDRMDLCVEVPAMSYEDLQQSGDAMSTSRMKAMTMQAFEIQKRRYTGTPILYNSQLTARDLKTWCPLKPEVEALLKQMYGRLDLSARTCHRIIKVARTCADLEASEDIRKEHILEACCYRNAGKKFWS